MTLTLYNLRHSGDQYRVTKFIDGNPEASYLTDGQDCDCPAGVRPTCRHRQMFPDLLPIANTEWFWDFDRHQTVDIAGNVKVERTVEPAPLHLGEPWITIEGNMHNQFVVVDSVPTTAIAPPQPFKRRI